MNTFSKLEVGRYRHYKGKDYRVFGVAKGHETLEEFVLYKPLYKDERYSGDYILRSKEEFLGEVEDSGKKVKRFEFLGEN